MEVEFSRQIFETCANNILNENPSSGSQAVRCGLEYSRTDRHYEANNRISEFCEVDISAKITLMHTDINAATLTNVIYYRGMRACLCPHCALIDGNSRCVARIMRGLRGL